MQIGNIEYVASDPASDFTAAIVQDAAAYADLLLPGSVSAGRTARARIKCLSIQSVENVAWEIWFFRKQRTGAEVITDVAFAGFWSFAAADAVQIGGAGLYYYYVDGLDIPYSNEDLLPNGRPDEDGQRKYLHLALIPRGAGKSAAAAGEIRIQVDLEPTLGW